MALQMLRRGRAPASPHLMAFALAQTKDGSETLRVTLDRICPQCKNTVAQIVWFYENEGRIDTENIVWRWLCPPCKGVLKKPTHKEIRRAQLTENSRDRARKQGGGT